MCEPVTIGALALSGTQVALGSLAIATTAASIYAGNKQAKAQAAAINAQNEQRAQEITTQKSKELTANAMRAQQERAAMRAAAAESGINLGSGSFLAALQANAAGEGMESGTIIYNEKVQQRARAAEARSAMSGVQKTTPLGAALKLGAAGASVIPIK